MNQSDNKYVLITAARNEENYIEETIKSVVCQSVLPLRWVIVDDDSDDRTYDIISNYADKYNFINPLHLERSIEWGFNSKANAINYGYAYLHDLEYNYIGIIDADVSFDNCYYQNILMKLNDDHKMGIAGGMIVELQNNKFIQLNYNLNSVSGAIQLFRRKCYEEIGGYVPSKRGGIDAIAEIMSRMHGWKVRSFPEIKVYHHRIIGTTQSNILSSRFNYGRRDYAIGNHPLFMFLKSITRFKEKPYFVGGMLMMLGYIYACFIREVKPISKEVVKYIKNEQMNRIYSAIQNKLFLK